VLAIASLSVLVQAAAAGDDISYEGCVSSDGSGGLCADAPGTPLDGAASVAVSPDGKSVYVTSAGSGTITHFLAAAGGQLTFDGCVSNDGSGGACADAPGSPLTGAAGVAVSPDGRSVYVTGSDSNTIVHFFAGPEGQLTYDGCVSDDGSGGMCVDAPGTPLTGANSVAVSPDGRSVYVTGQSSDDVVHFFAAAGGQLTYDGCVSDDGSGGMCVDAPGTPLTLTEQVAVSPDGRSVYVTSAAANDVVHFFAAAAGQLTYDGCVSNDGSGGMCVDAPGSPLLSADGLAVSPDGRSVYVTAAFSDDVVHFFAAAAGQLTYDGCVSNDGSGGMCADAPGAPFGAATAVAVSPDGKSVYVAAHDASTVTGFVAAPNGGQLTYDDCVSDDGSGGDCADAPGSPLVGAFDVAVSPNGSSLYATAITANDVVHFFRAGGSGSGGATGATGSTGSTGSTGTGTGKPLSLSQLAIAPHAFIPAGPKKPNKHGATVSYQLNLATTVQFAIVKTGPGREQESNGVSRCVAPTKKNRQAAHCLRTSTLATFTQAGHAGANSFHFSGRAKGAKLAPGSYVLAVTPSSGASAGLAAKVGFQINN
jgi:DNA-binding beta-propeller fold protein YncE